MMPIVEEYSRECLALETERSITAENVVETLARLFTERGTPSSIRSDNGPEFIAKAVMRWLAASGVETLYDRARCSVGEHLLGDLHKLATSRALEQGGVCQSEGGEDTDRRLP